ncbi:hypothetical protein PFL603g_06415 [Pseudomonas fluorescens]|uniref:Uncharacterized protein n=1 Tax=Pseudomonas fluorescens TaxID=294 RepID=A0A109KI08_PSEFL|nr:hypothetical protein PFL603g_06415 [Pseudomonas fluorescens]
MVGPHINNWLVPPNGMSAAKLTSEENNLIALLFFRKFTISGGTGNPHPVCPSK